MYVHVNPVIGVADAEGKSTVTVDGVIQISAEKDIKEFELIQALIGPFKGYCSPSVTLPEAEVKVKFAVKDIIGNQHGETEVSSKDVQAYIYGRYGAKSCTAFIFLPVAELTVPMVSRRCYTEVELTGPIEFEGKHVASVYIRR